MKRKKFYRFLLKDDKRIGVLYAPLGTDTRFGVEVLPVSGFEDMVFILKGGIYAPFMNSNTTAYFVNKELKVLIQDVIPIGYPIEFYPISVKSKEYGDKIYYLVHFKIIFDVIDEKNSIWLAGSIVKPFIDYKKAEKLDFFNASNAINEVIVSDRIKRLMKKQRLDAGIEFKEVPYV